jgi:GT2 family glycosyltransferase
MQPVSLYVPCYNGEKYIARCVEGLLELDDQPDDIIVIDDGSTDRTAEIVRRYPGVRLIQQNRNRGLAAARNRGLREARHDLVASADADVIVAKDWLTAIMRLAEEFPEATAYGGRLFETVTRTVGDKWRGLHLTQDWGPNRIVKPLFLYGANTLSRRNHILSLGGFDERLKTNGEDVDIAERLRKVGRYFVFDPTPVCYHLREDSLTSVLRMRWAWMRSPYSTLNPPQGRRELARFIWKRGMQAGLLKVRDDLHNRRYKMALVSLLAVADGARREISYFRAGKHRDMARMNEEWVKNKV